MKKQANMTTALYRDISQPIEARIDDLLARMTIEEKVSQLGGYMLADLLEDGKLSIPKVEAMIQKLALGVVHNVQGIVKADLNIRAISALQSFLIEKTRLGIPVIITGEGIHGHWSAGATIFPHSIAMSCSWNTNLLGQVASAIAQEASAVGVRQLFCPVLDLAREPRWGRTQETYGEDPYLSARLGVAYINGLQGGGTLVDREHTAATPKHFAAHGSPEGGINIGPVACGERDLRATFLPPFEAAVCEAHAVSVMNCYSELDGVPAARNKKLLTDILRHEWGFDGYVYSDWGSIEMLHDYHKTAHSYSEAGKQALEAGVGVDAPDPKCYGSNLVKMVKDGKVSMSTLDLAVSRMLRVKFKLGLFENPYPDQARALEVRNCAEHRALARKMAAESVVLLKNDGDLLPLREDMSSIAVIGPNAAHCRFGNYTGGGVETVNLLEGIRNCASENTLIQFAEGCGLYELSTDKISEAVEIARKADVAILGVGESIEVCSEGIDQTDLELPGVQMELVKAVQATGTPVVVVLINGRPLSTAWIAIHTPAVLEAFFPGEEQGNAIADIIFGRVNPSGKLSVSLPQTTGHIPTFYNSKPSRKGYYREPGKPGKPGRDYVFSSSEPLYEFGHGMSYTRFEYSDLKIAPTRISPAGEVTISAKIKNAGHREGAEVVQLFVTDVVSTVTTPVKELKRFTKINLSPGEQQSVSFTLKSEDLALFDLNMNRVVEPGRFEITIGTLKGSFDVCSYSPHNEQV